MIVLPDEDKFRVESETDGPT